MNVSKWQHRWHRIYASSVFYPTLAWNYLLGRILKWRAWSSPIDDHVIVGAYPFAGDVETMAADGVAAVVNTCAEYAGPIRQYESAGIEQLHIPTTDFTHPAADDVDNAVEFVQSHVRENRTVYIHCKAGRARSATVAMAWLIKYRGMTPQQAQAHLLQARPHINPRIMHRPVIAELVRRWQSESMATSDSI